LGKGREFEKLREYVPGDGYDEVHWKATARRGKPITKVFQIEKTQEIYVVIDASRLSAREPVPGSKFQIPGLAEEDVHPETWNVERGTSTLERYITAALMLGLAAEKQGDLFGLITFTDKVQKFVRAKNGKAHKVYLPPLARAQIDRDARPHLFASVSPTAVQAAVHRWHDRHGVDDRWTPHDLRRTFASVCGDLGIAPPAEIPYADAARHLSPFALSFYDGCIRARNDRLKRELGVTLRYPNYRDGLRPHPDCVVTGDLDVAGGAREGAHAVRAHPDPDRVDA
jgi:hypothetical protein